MGVTTFEWIRLIVLILFMLVGQSLLSSTKNQYIGLVLPILMAGYSFFHLFTDELFSTLDSTIYKLGLIIQAAFPAILLLGLHLFIRKLRSNKQ